MSDIFELGFRIDTNPLQQAKTAAEGAAASVSKLGDAEQKLAKDAEKAAQGLKNANDAAKGTGSGAGAAAAEFAKLSGTVSVSAKQLEALAGILGSGMSGGGLGGAMTGVTTALRGFATALGPVGAAAVGGVAAVTALGAAYYAMSKPLAEAADNLQLMEARLKNALGSQSAAKQSLDVLYAATQKTGLGFQAAAESFSRLARNGEALGATKDQILQLSDTIQKLGAVSGASRGEIQSGMIQLSQALASGRLNGDELRSIMENMPALAKAIADGLGVSVGQIRAMGAAGELTGSKVFGAILKASEKANQEFATLPDTVERANQRAADAWDRLLATLGQKWNSSGFVRSVSDFFTNMVNKTNQALQPDTLGTQISDLEARRARFAALPGVDAQRQVASIDKSLEALRAKAQQEVSAAAQANKETEEKLARAFIVQGSETGSNEFDDFTKKLKATTENAQKVQDALDGIRIRMASGIATDADRALIPALTRQAAIAQAELFKLKSGLDKLRQDITDSTAARALGGGGGGAGLAMQAIQAQRAAQGQVGNAAGDVKDYLSLEVQKKIIEQGEDAVASLNRQSAAQRAMANAVGGTREEMRKAETAAEAADKAFEMFGTIRTGEATAFMGKYAGALAASKKAADDFANAQARVNEAIQISIAQSKLDNVGQGYAQRLAASNINADQTALRDPVLAEMQRRKFQIEEAAQGQSQIFEANYNAGTNRQLSRVGMTAAQSREIELQRRIERAQANVAPGEREGLGAAMRAESASSVERDFAAQETALNRQLKLVQDRQKMVNLTSEEYRVQSALLEKRNELENAGASEAVIQQQLKITEEIQRQTIEYEKQRKRVEDIFSVVDGAAGDMKNVFVSSFEEMFTTGKLNADNFFNGLAGMVRKAGAEMVYEIAVKPFVMAAANWAKAGLSQFFGGNPFSAAAGGGGGGGYIDAGSVPLSGVAANGMAFDAGGVRRFASGGVFTNSIVSSPTMFRFANGGALGLMGEAGPEAIMPLRRDPSGRLGVSGGGGDVTVQVIDQRSNANSQPVSVEQQMGPDGRKFISVLVRDEVRRAMRNGEMDRDMQNNFGTTRPVNRM